MSQIAQQINVITHAVQMNLSVTGCAAFTLIPPANKKQHTLQRHYTSKRQFKQFLTGQLVQLRHLL